MAMLSDNINLKAFAGDVETYVRKKVSDNEFERQEKGSIFILEEWLSLRYPELSSEERLSIIKPLREVRRLRQKPAHRIAKDTYDKQFYARQDELVWKVYEALRDLRCLLATDPSVSSYEPPFWVREFPVKGY